MMFDRLMVSSGGLQHFLVVGRWGGNWGSVSAFTAVSANMEPHGSSVQAGGQAASANTDALETHC